MKFAVLTSLVLLLPVCAERPPLDFNAGPPRMQCKPEGNLVAQVDKPWEWACAVAGDLRPWNGEPIATMVITQNREEFPSISVAENGIQRVYEWSSTFDETYYRELAGLQHFDPWEFGTHDVIRDNDPTAPLPPIEGVEGSLDGSFWLEFVLYDVVRWDQAKREVTVGHVLARARVHGVLTCPQCAA